MRIIAEEHLGHWSARFARGSPGTFGGLDAFDAIRRLLETSPARHLTLEDFERDLEKCGPKRVEMVLIDRWDSDAVCPECGGTGRYVGLNTVDVCQTCNGLGRI